MSDRGPRADGHFAVGGHIALADPADANSPPVETLFEDFTSYKNRNSGMWVRGEMDTCSGTCGWPTTRSAIPMRPAISAVRPIRHGCVNSLFVGESDNIGNPRTPAEMAYGRSLPQPELADFPIRGYEFYDYLHHLDNVTFVNFQDNATRKTGAISYLLYTSFGMSTNNTVQRAQFVNAKPVYFPPMEHKWSNDDYGNGSYRTAVFNDVDGTVTGVPNSFILINDEPNAIAIDRACEVRPTWNAAVCTGESDAWRLPPPAPRRSSAAVLAHGPPVVRRGPALPASSSAARRSQPQWRGVHPGRRYQHPCRQRDQGDHRTAGRGPAPQRAGDLARG